MIKSYISDQPRFPESIMILMGLDMRYVYIYEFDVYPEVFP